MQGERASAATARLIHDVPRARLHDPELADQNLRAMDLMEAYNATPARAGDERRRLLAELLESIGQGTELRPPLCVDYGSQMSIGARCFANFGLVALDVAPIGIGDDVQIGPNVQLLTPTHPIEPEPRRAKWEAAQPITIGANVWLGGEVIVLPGVTIGENTVVGSGAVVARDLPANVVAAGNPRSDRAPARPRRPGSAGHHHASHSVGGCTAVS
jgi:maltose O-acetyltransferase